MVERLLPRGLRKEDAHPSAWFKDLAPSHNLRRWFGHDPQRWEELQRRYRAELSSPEKEPLLRELAEKAGSGAKLFQMLASLGITLVRKRISQEKVVVSSPHRYELRPTWIVWSEEMSRSQPGPLR